MDERLSFVILTGKKNCKMLHNIVMPLSFKLQKLRVYIHTYTPKSTENRTTNKQILAIRKKEKGKKMKNLGLFGAIPSLFQFSGIQGLGTSFNSLK